MQKFFSPDEYEWTWTEDYYKWDRDKAHKAALAARNKEAKELRKAGYKVRCYTMHDQLMSRGGIGSGKPHISVVCNVYALVAR